MSEIEWTRQRRADYAAGYEFAIAEMRDQMVEERSKCPDCDIHLDMRRFVTPWEPVEFRSEAREDV